MSSQLSDPPEIRALDEEVVNRIAAGEVIQRPSSAMKELLENSLDAGSTQISVVLKEGGLKLMQITDNGHGIRGEDLPILCHRHTTSKLSAYEDLETIQTLGFRGEALCSISFVSHMSVTTMTADSATGLKASYRDGELMEPGPQMCAANPGTTITVEDLFFNCPTRKKSFKNGREEYARILDVVSRYAVFSYRVAMGVKKQGEARVDLQAPVHTSQLDRIGNIYGTDLMKGLIQVSLSKGSASQSSVDSSMAFNLKGYISGVNYTRKKTVLVLFINGRCVECSQLKRTIEAVYNSVLPKATKPFAFIQMDLPPKNVDVNIHPTKREVHFAYQEDVIIAISEFIQEKLTTSNDSRAFSQTRLTWAPNLSPQSTPEENKKDTGQQTHREKAGGDHKLVRTDPLSVPLDAFVHHPGRSSAIVSVKMLGSMPKRHSKRRLERDRGFQTPDSPEKRVKKRQHEPQSAPEMVNYLLDEVDVHVHSGVCEILNGHTFVGMVDETLAFVQFQTGLYLIDTSALSQDMFYQQVLRQFEKLTLVKMDPAPSIKDLAMIFLDFLESKGEWDASKGGKDQICSMISAILEKNQHKLASWFSVIVKDGCLTGIPNILDGYSPDTNRLPELLVRLGRDVDWSSDVNAVDNTARLLSEFYAVREPLLPKRSSNEQESKPLCSNEWVMQHVIFAALRSLVKPPKTRALDGTIVRVTTLENLYRVFERC